MLEWTKEYGNIFQLRLLTDNRVRAFYAPSSLEHNKEPRLADNHSRTPPCQGRYLNLVVFMFDFNSLSSAKAILAAQFDAFEKG